MATRDTAIMNGFFRNTINICTKKYCSVLDRTHFIMENTLRNAIIIAKGVDIIKENIVAIQKLVEWANENPEKLPSATEASQSIGYERSYLSKLFKRKTGSTYRKYTTILKMGFAALKLRNTEIPVSKIAEELGYSDSVAFTHAFTHACGCSPTAYRKNPDSISIPF